MSLCNPHSIANYQLPDLLPFNWTITYILLVGGFSSDFSSQQLNQTYPLIGQVAAY